MTFRTSKTCQRLSHIYQLENGSVALTRAIQYSMKFPTTIQRTLIGILTASPDVGTSLIKICEGVMILFRLDMCEPQAVPRKYIVQIQTYTRKILHSLVHSGKSSVTTTPALSRYFRNHLVTLFLIFLLVIWTLS